MLESSSAHASGMVSKLPLGLGLLKEHTNKIIWSVGFTNF